MNTITLKDALKEDGFELSKNHNDCYPIISYIGNKSENEIKKIIPYVFRHLQEYFANDSSIKFDRMYIRYNGKFIDSINNFNSGFNTIDGFYPKQSEPAVYTVNYD